MSKHKIYNGLCSLILTKPDGKEESADEPVVRRIHIIDGQTVVCRKDTGTTTIIPKNTMVQILKGDKNGKL